MRAAFFGGWLGRVRSAFFGGWLGRVRAAYLCRGFTSGECWGLGRVGKCGKKVGGRLSGRFDNCSSCGSGSKFHVNSPKR